MRKRGLSLEPLEYGQRLRWVLRAALGRELSKNTASPRPVAMIARGIGAWYRQELKSALCTAMNVGALEADRNVQEREAQAARMTQTLQSWPADRTVPSCVGTS